MNLDLALQIFTLGVKYGAHQGKLGFEPSKMSDDDVAPVLQAGFEKHIDQICQLAKDLIKKQNYQDYYTQYWTTRQAFRFGLLSGFDEWPKTEADKKGKKMLDESTIDKLTQLQFRDCKDFEE